MFIRKLFLTLCMVGLCSNAMANIGSDPASDQYMAQIKKERAEIHYNCDHIDKQETINLLNKSPQLVYQNAQVLDMSKPEFTPLGGCFVDVVTDVAGEIRVSFTFFTMNNKNYMHLELLPSNVNVR